MLAPLRLLQTSPATVSPSLYTREVREGGVWGTVISRELHDTESISSTDANKHTNTVVGEVTGASLSKPHRDMVSVWTQYFLSAQSQF